MSSLNFGELKQIKGIVRTAGRNNFSISNSGAITHCTCNFFCPVEEGDAISCIVRQDIGSALVVKPPLVIIGKDTNTLMKFLKKTLRVGENKASSIFQDLNGYGNVHDVLCKLLDGEIYISELIPAQISILKNAWNRRMLRQLYLFGLTKRDINGTGIRKHNQILEQLLKNPFVLVNISMEKCIEILERQNKKPTDDQISCALIARTLYRNVMERGWTGTPSNFLTEEFPQAQKHINTLVEEYGVKMELRTIYLKKQYEVEVNLARIISEINTYPQVEGPIVTRGKIELGEDQLKALTTSLTHPLSIITGGAGTGKTTMISEVVHNLEVRGKTYLLCSFTGKAVSRIKDTVGRPSTTINRYLAQTKKIGEHDKLDDMGIPRYPDYIIVDEASMVTMELFQSLLLCSMRELKYPRIILIGDVNQLPPINWGSLLQGLLEAQVVPISYLLKNRRVYEVEGEEDGILINASIILNTDTIEYAEVKETINFTIIEDTNNVEEVIKSFKESGEKISIITPYNKELNFLNNLCQQYYSDLTQSITDGRGDTWYVGDRVMMLVNNYEINVMNGEEGFITSVSPKGVVVEFFGNTYGNVTKGQLFELAKKPENNYEEDEESLEKEVSTRVLTRSFAITIHKSQGSEYDFIIFYLPSSREGSFLNKHLLYTAITRARRALFFIGSTDTYINAMLKKLPWRCCNFAKRLVEGRHI